MNTDNPYRSGKPIMNIFNLFRSKNVRRYGHIQSLGYNCEPSFQFFQQYRFVESGLFSWTNNTNISTLTRALKDFDRIGTGEWEAVPPDVERPEFVRIFSRPHSNDRYDRH